MKFAFLQYNSSTMISLMISQAGKQTSSKKNIILLNVRICSILNLKLRIKIMFLRVKFYSLKNSSYSLKFSRIKGEFFVKGFTHHMESFLIIFFWAISIERLKMPFSNYYVYFIADKTKKFKLTYLTFASNHGYP